ncbi:expressed unknown protein [Seminavis robusta]|uniref:Uncharacterized protein n=1 Tax=Seminavis robusta TaxID=568900 RepID=A0A9N8DH35_9STRA|nr:expressed unknown protein [Seminavis robusta]|eukprot:Sro123_g059600.1 n/a (139) ;mRNA; f:68571-69112
MTCITFNLPDIVFSKDFVERTYTILNIKAWIALYCLLYTLPWILWMVIAAIVGTGPFPCHLAILGQDAISYDKFESISYDEKSRRVVYARTPQYVEEVKERVPSCFRGFVCDKERYHVNELDVFLKDHGMKEDSTESA